MNLKKFLVIIAAVVIGHVLYDAQVWWAKFVLIPLLSLPGLAIGFLILAVVLIVVILYVDKWVERLRWFNEQTDQDFKDVIGRMNRLEDRVKTNIKKRHDSKISRV